MTSHTQDKTHLCGCQNLAAIEDWLTRGPSYADERPGKRYMLLGSGTRAILSRTTRPHLATLIRNQARGKSRNRLPHPYPSSWSRMMMIKKKRSLTSAFTRQVKMA